MPLLEVVLPPRGVFLVVLICDECAVVFLILLVVLDVSLPCVESEL